MSQATEHSGHSALIQKRWPHAASERHSCLCSIHKMGHIQYIIKQREAFIREDYRAEEYSPDEKSPRQVFLFQNDFMLYDLRGTFEKRCPLYQWADSPTRMVSRVFNIRLDGVQDLELINSFYRCRCHFSDRCTLCNDVELISLHCWKLASRRSHGGEEEESKAWLHFTEKDDNSSIFYHFK